MGKPRWWPKGPRGPLNHQEGQFHLSQAHLPQGKRGVQTLRQQSHPPHRTKEPTVRDPSRMKVLGTHRWVQGIRHQGPSPAYIWSPPRENGRPAWEGLPPAKPLWSGPFAPGLCLLLRGAHSPCHRGRAPRRVRALTQQPWGTGVHDAILGRLEDGLGQGDGVPHHGPIQPIFRHDAASAPALLSLPPLGSAILEPDLRCRRTGVF